MINGFKFGIVSVLFLALVLVIPASGGIFTVPQGGTAFIGEQGLDITQTGVNSGSTIGWFSNGANVLTDAPAARVTVDDAKNLFIDPALFSSKPGPWYNLSDRSLAFYVADPTITLKIFDDSSNFDVTNGTRVLPRGDQASFRIDTNLASIANRPGVSVVPVTIYVVQPDNSQLSAVSGYPLTNIGLNASPFSTGPVWDTRAYQNGTYFVWAICNVNNINDNYQFDGKTQTSQLGRVQIQGPNPFNGTSGTPVPTTTAGTPITSRIPATPSPTIPATTQTLPPTTQATQSPGPGIVLVLAGLVTAAVILGRKIP
jgi:hypothetical protein